MIICNCPRCDEGFRVPSGRIPEDAHARCPWCHESYPIADVLRHLPPKLEITSADGVALNLEDCADHETAKRHAPSVDGILQPNLLRHGGTIEAIVESVPGADLEFSDFQGAEGIAAEMNKPASEPIEEIPWSPPASDSSAGDTNVDFSAGEPDPDWDQDPTLKSMNLAGGSGGRSRRKGAGIGTFIGIVLGGLASVPIAGLLLMLLGRTPDWGFWPFVADARSQFTRAASLPEPKAADPVPMADSKKPNSSPAGPSLRFETDDGFIDPDALGVQGQDDGVEAEADDILGSTLTQRSFRGSDSLPSEELQVADGSPADDATPSNSSAAPLQTDTRGGSESFDPVATEESAASLSAKTAVEPASANTGPSSSDANGNAFSRVASDNTESADLAAKAVRMIEMIASNETTPAERNRRLSITYMNIVKSAGMVDQPSESLRLLASVISSSPNRDVLGKAGWKWLATRERDTDGIALIGQIVVSNGKTTLSDGAGGTVSLIGNAKFADGQKLLILGRLVEQGSALRVYVAEPVE